jgi:hypothetical protein
MGFGGPWLATARQNKKSDFRSLELSDSFLMKLFPAFIAYSDAEFCALSKYI